jgi:undecaprenyl diphosphate synthase
MPSSAEARRPEAELARLRREALERPVPRHIAIVMDGNGRWAEGRGLPRVAGHRAGSESVRSVAREARRIGVRALTLYAFSAQNWERPPEEVSALMDLLREFLLSERAELIDNQIRLCAVGQVEKLPPHVADPLAELIEATRSQSEMVLTLALSYGSREELAQAARALAAEVAEGRRAPEAIDEPALHGKLWTRDLPDLDLLLRTGGERRLSNFLLWQAAYAELAFVDVAWPDFREVDLLQAVVDFQKRERRFGRTSAQLSSEAGSW